MHFKHFDTGDFYCHYSKAPKAEGCTHFQKTHIFHVLDCFTLDELREEQERRVKEYRRLRGIAISAGPCKGCDTGEGCSIGLFCKIKSEDKATLENFEKCEDKHLALKKCTTDELRAELKRRNEAARKQKEATLNSTPTCRNCVHIMMRGRYASAGYQCTIRFSDKSRRFHKCVRPSETCEDFARKTE